MILEDADLDQAAETCAAARLINGGQSCIAAKRFIVVEPRARALHRAVSSSACGPRRVGDPLDEATDVGPQARRDLRDELHRQVAGQRRARGPRCCSAARSPRARAPSTRPPC